MMFELPWEKDGRGNKAIYKEKRTFTIGFGLSKSFALSKMTEIDAISADFGEQKRSFYPSAWILFDSSDKLEFFGLYSREPFFGLDSKEWEQNLTQDDLPVAFLRKATWTISIERQAYKVATTPEEYIRKHLLGEKHVVTNNRFLNYENATLILALASKISHKIARGIKVEEFPQTEPNFEYIKYHFANGYMDYNFNYTPFRYKSSELENWGQKWREQFDKVEIDKTLNPTEEFRVFYETSIEKYFHRFRPYFTNVTYDKVT